MSTQNRFGSDRGESYDRDEEYVVRGDSYSGVRFKHRHLGFQTGPDAEFGTGYGGRYGGPNQFGEIDNYGGRKEKGHVGKGPRGYKRDDQRIKDDVCEALYRSRDVDASEIEVEVNRGQVFLKGFVESRMAKRQAENCVEDVAGVEDVSNELRVKPQDDQRFLERVRMLGKNY